MILCNSWNEYVDLYKYYKGESCGKDIKSFTGLLGNVLPKDATIKNLVFDDFHLSCDLILWNGATGTKLAFLAKGGCVSDRT